MNRVEKLMEYVDEVLLNKNNDSDRRFAYVHLYGVAQACAMIAKKRGFDIELAVMAGLLHDLYTYKRKDEVRHLGKEAIEEVIRNNKMENLDYIRKILDELKLTTVEETNILTNCHTKGYNGEDEKIHQLEKLVNDANVLQNYLYNPTSPEIKSNERLEKLLSEFGLTL